jgi:hypothetical protein
MPKQKTALGRPKINWVEGIRKTMKEGSRNEDLWKDRKQWSLCVGQHRKAFWNRYIYIYIYIYMYIYIFKVLWLRLILLLNIHICKNYIILKFVVSWMCFRSCINDEYKKFAICFTSRTNLLHVWQLAYLKKQRYVN